MANVIYEPEFLTQVGELVKDKMNIGVVAQLSELAKYRYIQAITQAARDISAQFADPDIGPVENLVDDGNVFGLVRDAVDSVKNLQLPGIYNLVSRGAATTLAGLKTVASTGGTAVEKTVKLIILAGVLMTVARTFSPESAEKAAEWFNNLRKSKQQILNEGRIKTLQTHRDDTADLVKALKEQIPRATNDAEIEALKKAIQEHNQTIDDIDTEIEGLKDGTNNYTEQKEGFEDVQFKQEEKEEEKEEVKEDAKEEVKEVKEEVKEEADVVEESKEGGAEEGIDKSDPLLFFLLNKKKTKKEARKKTKRKADTAIVKTLKTRKKVRKTKKRKLDKEISKQMVAGAKKKKRKGGKKKETAWQKHVKDFAKKNNLGFFEALKKAAPSFKKK